jgi:hypothetical protein
MREMIERLNVDTAKLARLSDVHSEARATCLCCRNTTECLTWLDAAEPNPEPPTFCPNLLLFGKITR